MNDRDRAYRRAQRKRIIDNRKRFLMEREEPDGLLAVRPEGFMADRHPYDCGRRCLMCHPRHVEPKARQTKAMQALNYEEAAYSA